MLGDGIMASLADKLKAIREPSMRRTAMAHLLSRAVDDDGSIAEETVGAIDTALVAIQRGNLEHIIVADALAAALDTPALVSYEARAALYTAAKSRGSEEVARLFFESSPSTLDAQLLERELAPERPLHPRGRPLALGERKTLARTHQRELLLQLLADPHPQVVEVLLENPHITERDVLVMASRRPSVPDSLSIVARSPRWRARYAVRRALVLNPHTPPHLSVRLLVMLRHKDQQLVAADANLPPTVRAQARDLVVLRRSALGPR